MPARQSLRLASWLLAALNIGLYGEAIEATRPTLDNPPTAWADLEEELDGLGVATDFDSVVRAARTSRDLRIRSAAVRLLGLRDKDSAVLDLDWVYTNDEEPLVRAHAALALARLGVPGGVDKLTRCFRESRNNPGYQLHLAFRLAELGDFVGYPEVVEAARSADEEFRRLAAEDLWIFQTAGAVDAGPAATPMFLMEKLLVDPAAKVRRGAILGLTAGMARGLDVEAFVPTITSQAKRDTDGNVREQAAIFLSTRRDFARARGATP